MTVKRRDEQILLTDQWQKRKRPTTPAPQGLGRGSEPQEGQQSSWSVPDGQAAIVRDVPGVQDQADATLPALELSKQQLRAALADIDKPLAVVAGELLVLASKQAC